MQLIDNCKIRLSLANKENGTRAADCRILKNSIIDDHGDPATDNDDDDGNDDD